MKLLSFAHKNEALSFFEEFKYIAMPELTGLYKTQSHYLLICGEGLIPSLGQISKALSIISYKYSENITEHINYGICGGLRESITLDKIYCVRSIYAEKSYDQMHFQSYHTSSTDSNIDIVSAYERVKNNDHKHSLSAFAHLVDREAWALARASHEFKIKFYCYKIVSDFAGDDTNCFNIQEQANKYSNKLFQHFQSLIPTNEDKQPSKKSEERIDFSVFHITASQQNKLDKLLHSASIAFSRPKTWVINQLPLDTIKKLKPAKKRTSALIYELECLINPVKKELTSKLESMFSETPKNFQISYDPEFESTELNIKIRIHSEEQKKQISKYLNELPYEKFKKLLNGDDYVI